MNDEKVEGKYLEIQGTMSDSDSTGQVVRLSRTSACEGRPGKEIFDG
jgi:hypothetical protein